MRNIRRRLQKLEARFTDGSGLVPSSQEWRDYWFPKVDLLVSGESPAPRIRIPLDVIDAIIAAGSKEANASSFAPEESSRIGADGE